MLTVFFAGALESSLKSLGIASLPTESDLNCSDPVQRFHAGLVFLARIWNLPQVSAFYRERIRVVSLKVVVEVSWVSVPKSVGTEAVASEPDEICCRGMDR